MAIETLRPNGTGDEENIEGASSGIGNHWQDVDEAVEDGATTQVWTGATNWQRDLYNIANHSVGNGAINFIKVYSVGWYTYPTGDSDRTDFKIAIKSGTEGGVPDTVSEGDEESLPKNPANRQLFSYQWNANPATSAAWTWDEIDNLQIGVSMRDSYSGDGAIAHCTQVYVEIDFTPAATEKTSSDTGSGVESTPMSSAILIGSETGCGIEALIARLLAAFDTGYGVEAIVEVGGQLKNLFATELGQGSDSITAKIEMPTKGGGMKLWT